MGMATLIGVLLCEVGLRVAGVSYPIFSQVDAALGSSLLPGSEGWYKNEGEAYVRINSAGLRDREHVLSKPARTFRIAVLGDSYAEAVQVPMEDAFWSVLERAMKGCPTFAGREIEVINFGVSGYGTAQELLMLRQRVWAYSPDIVLLAFVTGNDIRNNSRALEQESKKPYFVFNDGQLIPDLSFREALGFRATDVAHWMYRMANTSRIFQVFTEARRIAKARSAQSHPYALGIESVHAAEKTDAAVSASLWDGFAEAGLDATVYIEPRDSVWKEAWAVTEGLIVLMRDEVSAKGADFLVVTLSSGPQVHPEPALRRAFEKRLGVPHLFYPDFRIRDLGQREGFAVLNLVPLFETAAQEHQMFLHGFENSGLGMGHWNKEGHSLAGRLIAQKLCSDLSDHDVSSNAQQRGKN
jgi:hypothetical protein